MKNGEFEVGDVVVRSKGFDTAETGWLYGSKEFVVSKVFGDTEHIQLEGLGCYLFHNYFFDLVEDINDE